MKAHDVNNEATECGAIFYIGFLFRDPGSNPRVWPVIIITVASAVQRLLWWNVTN